MEWGVHHLPSGECYLLCARRRGPIVLKLYWKFILAFSGRTSTLEEQQHAFNHEAVAYLQTKGCPPPSFPSCLFTIMTRLTTTVRFPLHWKLGMFQLLRHELKWNRARQTSTALALQDELHCFYHVCCLVLEDAAGHTGRCTRVSLENVKEHVSTGGG